MPCSLALIKNVPHLSPEQDVESALKIFRKSKLEELPVVDDDDALLGYLSLHIVLKNLLPVSMNVTGSGMNIPVQVKAAPGIAKRLKQVKLQKVSDLMERRINTITPESALWEGISQMVECKTCLMLIEKGTGRFLGMMNRFSALEELENMQEKKEEKPR